MATDTDQTYCEWSLSDLSTDRGSSQTASISQMLDHGSISFGKFAVESLAWEKWSVFSNNRCQEELEKFKAPGIVAQKKAYFEEYYKKIRALKASQAEQQTNLESDHCQDSSFTRQTDDDQTTEPLENNVDVATTEEVKDPCDVPQAQFLETESMPSYPDSYGGSSQVGKQEGTEQQRNYCDDHDCKVTKVSMSIGPETSTTETGPESIKSTNRLSEVSESDDLLSNRVRLNVNKGEHHKHVPKDKAAALTRNKAKLDYRAKGNAVKPSEGLKSPLPKAVSRKAERSVVSSKAAPLRVTTTSVSSQRPVTEVRPNVTISRPSSIGRNKQAPSSSSVRDASMNAHLISKAAAKKLPSKFPVHAQRPLSVQSTPNDIAGTGAVRNMALMNRARKEGIGKSAVLINQHVIPKGRNAEDQRPIAMSVNHLARIKSNQTNEIKLGLRSDIKEGNQKRGKETLMRGSGSKFASSMMLPSLQHAHISKLEPKKIVPSRSVNLMLNGRKPRQGMPSWR